MEVLNNFESLYSDEELQCQELYETLQDIKNKISEDQIANDILEGKILDLRSYNDIKYEKNNKTKNILKSELCQLLSLLRPYQELIKD